MFFLPSLDVKTIETSAPGINASVTSRLIQLMNTDYAPSKKAPKMLFLNPYLETFAKKLNTSVAETYQSMTFISTLYSNKVILKAVLNYEDKIFVLHNDDIDEIKATGKLHFPDDPRVLISDAEKYVRYAYLLVAE